MSAEPLPVTSGDEAFITRLAAAHRAKNTRDTSALRRWTPEFYTPADLAAITQLTEGLDDHDYLTRAIVGKGFVTWHAGRIDVSYGYPGSSIGDTLRRLLRDPATELTARRRMEAVLIAESADALTAALTAAITLTDRVDRAPHWATLADDVRAWFDPATRNTVRLRWAQAFNTFPARTVTADKDRT